MAGQQPGTCKLCGTVGTVNWSHIVPRWTYRRVVQTAPALAQQPVQVRDEIAMFDGRQYAEYMLCDSCEDRIGKWENYVAGVALQTDDSFPAFSAAKPLRGASNGEHTLADAAALDAATIARFASSVIWRASVSATFDQVSLGGKYEQVLAQYLLDDAASFPANAALLVELYNPVKRPRIDRAVVPPESTKDTGYHVHQFCLFGMWFRLLVGGGIPAGNLTFCLARTGCVLLSDGRRLLESIAASARKAATKGRLARLK